MMASVICQGKCICQRLHPDLIKEMQQFCKSLFPVVTSAYCTIPTYPSGMSCKDRVLEGMEVEIPKNDVRRNVLERLTVRQGFNL